MIEIRDQLHKHGWIMELVDDWLSGCAKKIDHLLNDELAPTISPPYAVNSREELIKSLRWMLINEREKPKYQHWGSGVLPWDETEEWMLYRKRLNVQYKTFAEQKTLDRKRRRRVQQSLKSDVWLRTNSHCHFCREELPIENGAMDHIVPHSKGGSAELWNLIPVHNWCNNLRAAYPRCELVVSLSLGRWVVHKLRENGPATWITDALDYIVKRKISSARRSKS